MSQSSFWVRLLERSWKTLISLKFAVLVMAGLAICLAIATILESKYDTKTAQYVVYRSIPFYILLSLFGLLILAVAISRLPWKKRHIPFLMAHAGILMILGGSWLTAVRGVDGNLRITEGEVNSAVELDDHVLVFSQGSEIQSIDFPWVPSFEAAKFQPRLFAEYGVRVDRFVSDAELKLEFSASPITAAGAPSEKQSPAVQFRIVGAPMGGPPEVWLWAGDPAWATQKMGPARFLVRSESQKDLSIAQNPPPPGEARFDFIIGEQGKMRFEAVSPRGEKKSGPIVMPLQKDGVWIAKDPIVLDPGWKMPIKIALKRVIPQAFNRTHYAPVKGGKSMGGAPLPAIQISTLNSDSTPAQSLWLGLGDRADLKLSNPTAAGSNVSIGYFPKRIVLPFALRLKQFEMKHNPGTMDPSAYSSHVQVVEQIHAATETLSLLPSQQISMNEPLKHGGYTFYQASYIPDMPRPTTTILSVNYDPGRLLKYLGSLLLVGGSVFLYLVKLAQSKRAQKNRKEVTA